MSQPVVSFRIPNELKEEMDDFCRQDGRDRAHLIAIAVQKFIRSHKPALAELYVPERGGDIEKHEAPKAFDALQDALEGTSADGR